MVSCARQALEQDPEGRKPGGGLSCRWTHGCVQSTVLCRLMKSEKGLVLPGFAAAIQNTVQDTCLQTQGQALQHQQFPHGVSAVLLAMTLWATRKTAGSCQPRAMNHHLPGLAPGFPGH
ncbi:hypothetical protein IHE44_0004408 [Lamprotornis superbus]|uniref:Uncharacterized protein n=1 Tax=Lamprotornis superbus TaxID=245042 RepID=A0A835NKR8_9PASS|nr:hypothetical protein IHE44_0004408 [Lamprotornis superbus]